MSSNLGLLKIDHLDSIQETVNKVMVPRRVGRIPSTNNASFTTSCIYSMYVLHGKIPLENYNYRILFAQACILLLQPAITLQELQEADKKLVNFCKIILASLWCKEMYS